MLTRSPIPATSPSASPNSFRTGSFHYAPASSPHQSPRVSSTLSRRHQPIPSPSGAVTPFSSSQAPPQQSRAGYKYVGVDAATQYSPMEPVNYAAPRHKQPSSHLNKMPSPSQPPLDSIPRPMIPGDRTSMAQSPSATIPSASDQPPMIKAPHPLSPTKRRNSQGPGSSIREASASGESAQALSKRAKANIAPPKLLPIRYELCPVEDMVVLISNMLAELIETNDSIAMKSGHLTRFHSRTAPGISVLDYLHRLAKHATLTPPLLLSMVYYIDRLCALYPDFTINTLTVHRFLITAATVAAKGLSDSFWNNSTYARVGGVRVQELKLLELEFLYRVDWKIVPNPEVLVAYYRGLVERSPAYVLEDEQPQKQPPPVVRNKEGSDDIDEDEDDADETGDGDAEMSNEGPGDGQGLPGKDPEET